MSDHVPPQDLEAETAVLGAMMVSDRVLPGVLTETHLRPEHFYRKSHGLIFTAILALSSAGEPIDSISVADKLKETGKLKDAGGRPRVTELPNTVPAPGNAIHYAKIVLGLARWRQRLTATHVLQEAALERDEDKLAVGRAMLDEEITQSNTFYDLDRQREELYAMAEGGDPADFRWPWGPLNEATDGGMRRGELIILSGYTGDGKSHAADMVLDLNAANGAKCCLYDNEFHPRRRAARRVTRQTGIPPKAILQAQMTDQQRVDYVRHLNHGTLWPIDDSRGRPADEVCHDIRVRDWDLVVVDILHNFRFHDERELANTLATFKATAALANCTLILCAHVNRGGIAHGERRRPVKSDLRWSGDIENLADSIFFVWREQDRETKEQLEEGFIYADKLRHGDPSLATQAITFNPRRLRFEPRKLRQPQQMKAAA